MQWLSEYLIEVCPNVKPQEPDLKFGAEKESNVFVATGLASKPGVARLLQSAVVNATVLKSVTDGIHRSVKPIVSKLMAENSTSVTLADDMKKMETYLLHSNNWITVAENLMSNCFGMRIDLLKIDVEEVLSKTEVNIKRYPKKFISQFLRISNYKTWRK